MKGLWSDPWAQLLGFLVVISGALTVHGMVQGIYQAASAFEPLPSVDSRSAADTSPYAPADRLPAYDSLKVGAPPPSVGGQAQPSLEDVLLGRAPASAAGQAPPVPAPGTAAAPPTGPPPSASLTGSGVQKAIAGPKKAGQWVVDARRPADADSGDLAAVLASVKDGDTVLVRPGVYEGGALITKSIRVLGQGKTRDEVVIKGTGPTTLAVAGGKVLLKNLTLDHAGPQFSKALRSTDAELEVWGLAIRGAGTSAAIELERGSLTATGSTIHCAFAGVVAGQSARVKLTDLRISGCKGFGVGLTRQASLEMKGGEILGSGSFGLLLRDAHATLSQAVISGGKDCGIGMEGGSAVLKSVRVVRNACGIKFLAGGKLEATGSLLIENAQGAVVHNQLFRALIELKSSNTRPPLTLEATAAGGIPGAPAAAPGPYASPRPVKRRFGQWDIFSGRRWGESGQ